MSWAVSVFENGKLYQRIQYKDKNKALNEFHRQGAKYGGSKCHEVELKEISNGQTRSDTNTDVTECLGIAYEEIKNRKGKMINGTFVKEEDL